MNSQPYGVSRFRRAFVHFIGGRVVQATARAILLLVLVRLLPVEDYGAYMLLVGLSEMMLLVASFGILPVAQRFVPQMISTLSAARFYRFVITLVLFQIIVLSLVTVGLLYIWDVVTIWMRFSEAQIEAARPAFWLFLLVPAFRFIAELLEALLEQGKAQIVRAVMPIGRVISIGLLLLLGVHVELSRIIMIDIVVTAFCLFLAYLMLRQSLGMLNASDTDGEIPVREMIRFGWHMAAVNLMGSTSSPGAIRLVLANALGIVESGLFAFLQSLQRLIGRYLPGTLLRGMIRPALVARAFRPDGMKIVEAGAGLLFKSNLLIIAAGSVVIAVGGDALVDALSGGKFTHAGFTLLLMFLALAVTAQTSVIEMVLQITGHTATLRATSVIVPVALLAVWLLADWGLNAAVLIIAFATALSNWIGMSMVIRSSVDFNVDWRGLAAIVIPAGMVITLGTLMATEVSAALAAGTAMVLFLLLLWLAKPFNSQELAVVERVAGMKIAKPMGLFSYRKNIELDEA